MSWLQDWNKRKSKTINGTTAGIQTNYPLQLTINKSTGTDTATTVFLGSNVKDDFSDIRFTSVDGITLLNYYIESSTPGVSAIVWVSIPTIPTGPGTTSIYLYYDNPFPVPSLSNPDNVFLLFDQFSTPSSNADTAIWTPRIEYENTAYPRSYAADIGITEAGKLRVYAQKMQYGEVWYSVQADGIILSGGYSIEAAWSVPGTINSQTGSFLELRDKNSPTGVTGFVEIGLISSDPYNPCGYSSPTTAIASTQDSGGVICNQTLATSGKFKIDVTGSTTNLYYDIGSGYLLNTTYTIPFTDAYIGLTNKCKYTSVSYTSDRDTRWDYVRARRFASPEPAFGIIGTEEYSAVPCSTIIIDEAPTIEPPISCPTIKYSGDQVILRTTPRDGVGPYYVSFKKDNVIIPSSRLGGQPNPITDALEGVEIVRIYILDDLDISSSLTGTIDFLAFVSDSCPLGAKSSKATCTVNIGCLAPVCNFVVT